MPDLSLKLKNPRYQLAIVVFGSLLISAIFYGRVMIDPGAYMFHHGNDAVKNYYALAWYVEHEEGLDFGGMKYPHDGFYLQTDGHPPVGFLLKWLGASGSFAVALINWLMVISIPLSIVLFYLVFRRLKIPWVWAFLASLSIIALSPQIDRMEGHFALSYMFFFPLTFLFILDLMKAKPLLPFLKLLGLIIACYFLHPYLGVMLTFIALGFIPYFLFHAKKKGMVIGSLVLFLAGLVPLGIWKIVMELTDPVQNRTTDPWGFLEFVTRWESLLMPHHYWPGILPAEHFPVNYWEGQCYIGVGSYILALGMVLLIPRITLNWRLFAKNLLLILPCAAAIVLAFGYPFSAYPWIAEKFHFLVQFRALGRLSWIFYYLAIGGMFFALLKHNGRFSTLYRTIAGVAAFFFLLEGGFVHNQMGNSITESENLFSKEKKQSFLMSYPQALFEDIEAIVPAPMYYAGSDTYSTTSSAEVSIECLTLSYYTGIPTTANSTSREPVLPSLESIHLTSPSFYPKSLLQKMDSSYHSLGVLTTDSLYEEMGYDCCGELVDPLLTRGDWHLYSQKKADFEKRPISLDSTTTAALNLVGDTILSSGRARFEFFNFDRPGLVKTEDYNLIGEFQDSLAMGKHMTFSCWVHNPKLTSHPGSIFVETIGKDLKKDWIKHEAITKATMQSGDSTLFELKFEFPKQIDKVYFYFFAVNGNYDEVYLSHALVRQTESDVYEKVGSMVSKNNHLFLELGESNLIYPKRK